MKDHRRSGSTADPGALAEKELDWWQLRREHRAAADYGAVVASVNADLYGVSDAAVLPASILRADAMHFRDERSLLGLRPDDWAEVERRLTTSYTRLLEAVRH